MDKQKMSSDEYSGSSDEQNLDKSPQTMKKDTYSLSIEVGDYERCSTRNRGSLT